MTLNLNGSLYSLDTPKVMAIINVTTDSFYAGSRAYDEAALRARIRQAVEEGADMLDLGGCSARPGSEAVTPDEEYTRLARGLEAVEALGCTLPVSIDTYRADVVQRCCANFRVDIINDISGGQIDPELWPTVARLKKAYVLTHMRGTPATMATLTDYTDVTADVIEDLQRKCARLRQLGVADIILDPGFGFAKTLDQNYALLRDLDLLALSGLPVLAGVSRKSMIYRYLDIDAADALAGTITLDTIALMKGANIIRVHDVAPAVQQVRLVQKTLHPYPTTT